MRPDRERHALGLSVGALELDLAVGVVDDDVRERGGPFRDSVLVRVYQNVDFLRRKRRRELENMLSGLYFEFAGRGFVVVFVKK